MARLAWIPHRQRGAFLSSFHGQLAIFSVPRHRSNVVSWRVTANGRFIFIVLALLGVASPSNGQFLGLTCQPGQETFRGQVKEITQIESSTGASSEYLQIMKFDSHGNMTEASEGSRSIGTTDVQWRSKSVYAYDASRRLSSITGSILFDPVIQSECAFGYSETGDLTIVVQSHEKRFKSASMYVYSQGKRIKEFDYSATSKLPWITIHEYDDRGIECIRSVEHAQSSRRTYDERGKVAMFEAYEGNTLIAYETMIYNERGDLTEFAHYRPGDILIWRDLWRYEYDEVGNWTSNEHTKTGEETGKSPAMLSLRKRSITYYNALPLQ